MERDPGDGTRRHSPSARPASARPSSPHPSTKPWRVLVLAGDATRVHTIAQSLQAEEDFHVIDRALTAEEARRKVRPDGIDVVVAERLSPDEIREVGTWLRERRRGELPHIVATGLSSDSSLLLQTLEVGATTFTMEDFSVRGLRLTLRLLARGESVFPLDLQHLMSLRLSELAEVVRTRGLEPDMLWTLTAREGEVLLLIEEGLTNQQIAHKLYISEGTVKSHVHQILKKLKVRDRNEAGRILQLQRAAPGNLVLRESGFKREE